MRPPKAWSLVVGHCRHMRRGDLAEASGEWACRNACSLAATSSSLPPFFLSPSCLPTGQGPPPPLRSLPRCSIPAHRTRPLETELSETSSQDKLVHLYTVCWALSGDDNNLTNPEEEKKKRERTNYAQCTETPAKTANKVPRGHRQGGLMDKEGDSESPVIAALLVSSLALLDVTPASGFIPSLFPHLSHGHHYSHGKLLSTTEGVLPLYPESVHTKSTHGDRMGLLMALGPGEEAGDSAVHFCHFKDPGEHTSTCQHHVASHPASEPHPQPFLLGPCSPCFPSLGTIGSANSWLHANKNQKASCLVSRGSGLQSD